MAEGDQGEDKTETATARHLDQARSSGQVPVSKEVTTFAGLALVVLVLAFQFQIVMRHLLSIMALFLSHIGEAPVLEATGSHQLLLGTLGAILPTLIAAMSAGAFAVLLQTNFLIHLGGLQPRMSRINPASGMKRIFGFAGLTEIGRSLIKVALLTSAMWIFARADWNSLADLPWESPYRLLLVIAKPTFHLFLAGIATQGLVACADMLWVRFRHARDMRMSKQDIRDELKDTDGNPHIKAKIRRIQMIRARKRMMAKVPTAAVVITNPTHYAVALAYDRAVNPAPRIVAKGVDALAGRIRDVARENGVPVVANPPLARALHRLDLDIEIPAEHYKAVAEIIAYVWRLRGAVQAVM